MPPGGQGNSRSSPCQPGLLKSYTQALIVVARVEPWLCSVFNQGHHNNQLPLPLPSNELLWLSLRTLLLLEAMGTWAPTCLVEPLCGGWAGVP